MAMDLSLDVPNLSQILEVTSGRDGEFLWQVDLVGLLRLTPLKTNMIHSSQLYNIAIQNVFPIENGDIPLPC